MTHKRDSDNQDPQGQHGSCSDLPSLLRAGIDRAAPLTRPLQALGVCFILTTARAPDPEVPMSSHLAVTVAQPRHRPPRLTLRSQSVRFSGAPGNPGSRREGWPTPCLKLRI